MSSPVGPRRLAGFSGTDLLATGLDIQPRFPLLHTGRRDLDAGVVHGSHGAAQPIAGVGERRVWVADHPGSQHGGCAHRSEHADR